MRKIKQTLVMLLAAVMLLGTVTTAMAATAMSDKGSVKITNAVAGVTYKLYRIFDISGISGDNKAAFITNAKWNDAVRNFGLGFGEFVGTDVGSAVTIKDFNSDANAQELAKKWSRLPRPTPSPLTPPQAPTPAAKSSLRISSTASMSWCLTVRATPLPDTPPLR